MTAGGWGPAIGDEGSGFLDWAGGDSGWRFGSWIAGGSTGLLEAIRAAWGAKDLGDLVGFANARPGPDFASLAPVVAYRASESDEVAAAVLRRAGVELAEQVQVVWKRMQAAGQERGQVAYTGGVLEKIAEVREAMKRRIEAEAGLSVREGAVKTMEGAMWRARQHVAVVSGKGHDL